MKLLLNDKEIAFFLSSNLDHLPILETIRFSNFEVENVINYINIEKSKKKFHIQRMRKKFKDRIQRSVTKDLSVHLEKVNHLLSHRKEYFSKIIHKKLDHILDTLGKEFVIEQYRSSNITNFIKGTGYSLDADATMMRRKEFTNYQEDCLLRNTVGNEELLISKIDNNYPFWFIDSGYTNFLEPNKKWHRLVRNHLHQGVLFDAPVDRLGNFKTFPQQWRTGGDKILVIEPGSFAAGIFHVDVKQWKYQVEAELRKYTDKPIVFREKLPKKSRPKLYNELCNEDYYCVVNINSNAATESIWAGVPVITLDKHVSNPVARNKLSDINDLYRGPLAHWLAMLSYSQFTYEELINGTAAKLVRKYHV